MILDDATWAAAGQRVIAYRMAHGLRRGARQYPMQQETLATRAGVSVGCLRGFENGTRRTTRGKLERIAAACDMTYDALTASASTPAPIVTMNWDLLTDESAAVARLFGWAHTGARMRIIAVLREHYEQRTDAVTKTAAVSFAIGLITAVHGMRAPAAVADPVPAGEPVTVQHVLAELAHADETTLRRILAALREPGRAASA